MGALVGGAVRRARQRGRARRIRRAVLPAASADEPMIEFMRELRGARLQMAICTNNIREWEAHWRAMLPVVRDLRRSSTRRSSGAASPSRGSRDHARAVATPRPKEALFIDDVEVNCEGRGTSGSRRSGSGQPRGDRGHRGSAAAPMGTGRREARVAAAIIEIAHNAFVTLDADGTGRRVERRATELFGDSREEALGFELAELIVPRALRDRHRARSASRGRTGRRRSDVAAPDRRGGPPRRQRAFRRGVVTVDRAGAEPLFTPGSRLVRAHPAAARARGAVARARARVRRDPRRPRRGGDDPRPPSHPVREPRAVFESMGFTSLWTCSAAPHSHL